MAFKTPTLTASFLLLFFFFLFLCFLLSSNLTAAPLTSQYPSVDANFEKLSLKTTTSLQQEQSKEGELAGRRRRRRRRRRESASPSSLSSRRLMIGSIAPICTYNECRGCRFKCTAEQVPVDANDPMNSAYHYRCVCHR